MKVNMQPGIEEVGNGESGIHTIIREYTNHFPKHGIELSPNGDDADVIAIHAGLRKPVSMNAGIVCHVHGLYWTGDYPQEGWQHKANANVIKTIRMADVVTVPSAWVAKCLMRDMKIVPHVIPHGVNHAAWEQAETKDYIVAYAKNRAGQDVCDPSMAYKLASVNKDKKFLFTFLPKGMAKNPNTHVTGVVPYEDMKAWVRGALVFVSDTKETFGIAALEALACGVPVLAANHGAVPEFVKTGVNGYVYQAGNINDMKAGLDYCLRHRDVLSSNAIITAQEYTWDNAVHLVAESYQHALERAERRVRDNKVSFVIPVYNKPAKSILRAITSIGGQVDEVIVVDDGSEDESIAASAVADSGLGNVTLIRTDNRGVANARNLGISRTRNRIIGCLDADDYVSEGYIEAVLPALKDPLVGIAYSRLNTVFPGGMSRLSDWPDEFDPAKQVGRFNQVPTCCLFKKEAWQRVGGYKQRYAPSGAGTEDADMWLRILSIGYEAKLATSEPLFNYSIGVGHTSKPGYREEDWIADKPWMKDKRHPFASVLVPENKIAHPVRSYDPPVVSVVIPCHYGHLKHVVDALDSLEGQTFKDWEVIIVINGESNDGEYLSELMRLRRGYPYARLIFMPASRSGAGAARNLGVENATAPLINFLDADDMYHPDFLKDVIELWQKNKGVIYTDFLSIEAEDSETKGKFIRNYGTKKVYEHVSLPFDCARATKQPETLEGVPYLWCNVNILMSKKAFADSGGFDEKLESYEDVEFMWRLARLGNCFHRVPKSLMTYRAYTGSRRTAGLLKKTELLQYIASQLSQVEIKDTMCGCSKSSGTNSVTPGADLPFAFRSMATASSGSPSDMVMVDYLSANQARHQVIGASKKQYGYRVAGDRFLVTRGDIMAQPHLFSEVVEQVVHADAEPVEELPEPQLMLDPTPVKAVEPPPLAVPTPTEPVSGPSKASPNTTIDYDGLGINPRSKSILLNLGVVQYRDIPPFLKRKRKVSGIGPSTIEKLKELIS